MQKKQDIYELLTQEDKEKEEDNAFIAQNYLNIVKAIKDGMAKQNKNINDSQNNQEETQETKKIIDKNTGKEMIEIDIGSKHFGVAISPVKIPQLENVLAGDKNFLFKFHRTDDKNIMSEDEIASYVQIKNGELNFLRTITPQIAYRLTKSINKDFYLVVDEQGQIIPLSNLQAQEIIKNNAKASLGENLHISNFQHTKTNLLDELQAWFGRNVPHPHPYAWSDMVITKQAKHYQFDMIEKNGKKTRVKTTWSNELTDIYLSKDNLGDLEHFAGRCKDAFKKATTKKEVQLFAMPIPLYSEQHMLSLVVAFKPNGEVNITIINANGMSDASKRYAGKIVEILDAMFEKYANHIRPKYHFKENNSQIGGTCMTHADYITKKIAKDTTSTADGKNVNPIRIWEKAYIRGFATTMYQKAQMQNRNKDDDIENLQKDGKTKQHKCKTPQKMAINRSIQHKQNTNLSNINGSKKCYKLAH